MQPRHAVVAGGAALCLVVAGCGSGHSQAAPTSTNAILTAYTHTMTSRSARETVTETVSVGGRHVTITVAGEVDFADQDAQLAVTEPEIGTINMRVISPELYMQLPGKDRGEIPGAKPWISLNLDQLTEAKLGASLSQLSGSAQTPTQTLSYLQSVSKQVTKVGSETLQGVVTTEYSASIDLTRAAATKSAKAKAAVTKLEGEIHRTTLPIRVWVDGQDRVRQETYRLAVTASGRTSQVGVTLELSSYGVPVSVTAPPAAQIFDATSDVIKAAASG